MRCARKPTSVEQPKRHLLSTSSTACWRWDAQATSASYETTRTRDHRVHRLIHATRSLFTGPPLGALEERQNVVPTPAAIAKLRPVVVILRLAADVDQPVDRRRAAEHAAARV